MAHLKKKIEQWLVWQNAVSDPSSNPDNLLGNEAHIFFFQNLKCCLPTSCFSKHNKSGNNFRQIIFINGCLRQNIDFQRSRPGLDLIKRISLDRKLEKEEKNSDFFQLSPFSNWSWVQQGHIFCCHLISSKLNWSTTHLDDLPMVL